MFDKGQSCSESHNSQIECLFNSIDSENSPMLANLGEREGLLLKELSAEPLTRLAPHLTEVKAFGKGFIPGLNPMSATSVIPECSGGFKNIAVARTRILQGSHLDITGHSKGKHLFECCIHPWMRMEVDVK
jgi:hypothetical protein